jgi:hypothetical protein
MNKIIKRTFTLFRTIFLTPPDSLIQILIILLMSLFYIWMPQKLPIDWDLNTKGFWSNIPQTYMINRNFVYPPWGLILMLPYYLIHAVGARVLSAMLIGWLTHLRKWPLSYFFAIVLSPYFLLTMARSDMDILVIVFPVLLWEIAKGKRWESIARGISISILLLKPQCTLLLLIYLLWTNRKEWKKILVQLGIVAGLIVPINFVGSPPLLFQWLANILHPSPQNLSYWSINNISLTARFGILISTGILLLAILILALLLKGRVIAWKIDQTISSLLLGSMYLTPYTSQQSLSSGLAFIPSWPGFLLQWFCIGLGAVISVSYNNLNLFSFLIGFLSLGFYAIINRKSNKDIPSTGSAQIGPS